MRIRLLGCEDAHIRGQERIQAVDAGGLAWMRCDLPAGMHARIGAPRNRERHSLLKQLLEDGFERALDRSQPGLGRPAGELGPVVFEKKPAGQTSSRKTISVASERRGPSFRILV